jgi:hypothetical protein
VKRLTSALGNDAHQGWSPDGEHIVFASSRMGFKDEGAYTDAPQPYGELFVMRADGTGVELRTDNQWEEGAPAWREGRGAGRCCYCARSRSSLSSNQIHMDRPTCARLPVVSGRSGQSAIGPSVTASTVHPRAAGLERPLRTSRRLNSTILRRLPAMTSAHHLHPGSTRSGCTCDRRSLTCWRISRGRSPRWTCLGTLFGAQAAIVYGVARLTADVDVTRAPAANGLDLGHHDRAARLRAPFTDQRSSSSRA